MYVIDLYPLGRILLFALIAIVALVTLAFVDTGLFVVVVACVFTALILRWFATKIS